MKILNLYAQLQINPRNQECYRQILEFYRSIKMENEANAFKKLIEKKFNDNSPHIDKE
jgi:hypothetical protein